MATVTMRYWAAAKQAAGVAEETISADTLGDALAAALAGRDGAAALGAVLARSSFLVDGAPVGARAPDSCCSPSRPWWRCCRRSPAAERGRG